MQQLSGMSELGSKRFWPAKMSGNHAGTSPEAITDFFHAEAQP
jgi:hypothetical protein